MPRRRRGAARCATSAATHGAEVRLGAGLTVIHGPNGAGKTNLLEALYFGCTGRSCRTSDERQVVRFDAPARRARRGGHARPRRRAQLPSGFQPGEAKRFKVDGAPVERLVDSPARPLVSVFLPDRLELVKGPPALRRAHLDQVVAALWPARAATRRAYAAALAQRNALLGRIRAGRGSATSMPAWDAELRPPRRSRCAPTAPRRSSCCARRSPPRPPTWAWRARRRWRSARGPARADAEELAAELGERPASPTSSAGSPGTARTATTSRCCATAASCAPTGRRASSAWRCWRCCSPSAPRWPQTRGGAPLLLLDDVMSELDAGRRERLVERVRPAARRSSPRPTSRTCRARRGADVVRIAVAGGTILQEAAAARMRPPARPGPGRGRGRAPRRAARAADPLAAVQRAWPEAVGPRSPPSASPWASAPGWSRWPAGRPSGPRS